MKSERRRFRATEGARVGLLRRFNAAVEARDGRALPGSYQPSRAAAAV